MFRNLQHHRPRAANNIPSTRKPVVTYLRMVWMVLTDAYVQSCKTTLAFFKCIRLVHVMWQLVVVWLISHDRRAVLWNWLHQQILKTQHVCSSAIESGWLNFHRSMSSTATNDSNSYIQPIKHTQLAFDFKPSTRHTRVTVVHVW